ncbi:MAG: hypothetical protein ABGW48_05680, partial [Nitrosopumilus sp.]
FVYDESLNKISYEIPFDWNDHSDSSSLNQIISFNKDFSSIPVDNELLISLNDVEISNEFYEFNISNPEKNSIKIEVPHNDLFEIKNKLLSTSNNDSIKLEILSGEKINFNDIKFSFENDIIGEVYWNSNLVSGKNIPFTFSFYDKNNIPVTDLLFVYGITDSSGKEIWSNIGTGEKYLGILAPDGIYQESIFIPTDGEYEFKLILTGQYSNNFENFLVSTSNFEINSQSILTKEKTSTIPNWIKNNAEWWAAGAIDDDAFIQGIQFLIKEGILEIPSTSQGASSGNEIPNWIKNNAEWWAAGAIDDDAFIQGIQFLIKEGILEIQ